MSHTNSPTISPTARLPIPHPDALPATPPTAIGAARGVTIPAQRSPTDQASSTGRVQACRCGHGADSHEHFRPGSNCSGCACGRYRTTTSLATTLSALLRRTLR